MQRTPQLFARGRWTVLREIVLIVVTFLGYQQVRHLTKGDTHSAFNNARDVVEWERTLHVFAERPMQELAMRIDGAIAFLNHYYVYVHFPLSFGFVGWVVLRHRDLYPRFRNWFLSVTMTALVIHVAFPLAPPRMLEHHGFVDTLQTYGPRIYTEDTNASVANQFAAMPSLHFGWALLIAMMFVRVKGGRWSWLAMAHPLITLLAIVCTANHYLADAAVAAVLVVGIDALLRVVARRQALVPSRQALRPVREAIVHGTRALPAGTASVGATAATLVSSGHGLVGAPNLPGGTLALRGESPASPPLVTRRKQRARHHHPYRRSHRQDRHCPDHGRRLSGVGDP